MLLRKLHNSTFILVVLILISLTCVLAGGGNVQAATPIPPQEVNQSRTALLIPELQEVTLGDEYRSAPRNFFIFHILGQDMTASGEGVSLDGRATQALAEIIPVFQQDSGIGFGIEQQGWRGDLSQARFNHPGQCVQFFN